MTVDTYADKFDTYAEASKRKGELVDEAKRLQGILGYFKAKTLLVKAEVEARQATIDRADAVKAELTAVNRCIDTFRRQELAGTPAREVYEAARVAMNRMGDRLFMLEAELAEVKAERDQMAGDLAEARDFAASAALS